MVLYLTSDPIDREERCLQKKNGFSELFLAALKSPCHAVYVCADPTAQKENDESAALFFSCLEAVGVTLSSTTVLDARNQAETEALIARSDLVVLGDGDVCTQHAFFEEIKLALPLVFYQGVVLGIGSGSVNAAIDVFVQPKGMATDLFYKKRLFGLALTRISVVPHYIKGVTKGADVELYAYEHLTFTGERIDKIYAIPDGSFVLCEQGASVMFGEGYLIEDDHARFCCNENECHRLN